MIFLSIFICFYFVFIYFSFGANGATSYTELTLKQVPAERLSGLNRFS